MANSPGTCTGFLAWDAITFLIGILAFPALVICHIIRVNLLRAKENEHKVEKLQQQVAQLEQTTSTSGKTAGSTRPAKKTPYTIVHIDDEQWLLDMIKPILERFLADIRIVSFLNRDEAWDYISEHPPDLLITDLFSDNVPGRTDTFGMNGFELLQKLDDCLATYPILVFSGSLAMDGIEDKAMECAGDYLTVDFLVKPATEEEINAALLALLQDDTPNQNTKQSFRDNRNPDKRIPNATPPDVLTQSGAGLTKAQQLFTNEIITRAGKPSPELQREIDEIRAAKTEDELVRIFSRGSKIERPTIEAELLSLNMLAKLAELNPTINAGAINEERQNKPANPSSIGFCPKCKSEVLEGSTGYFCRRRGCSFKIAGVIVGQALNKGQVSKLLTNGRTDLLSDFVYESGERFSACLILDAGGNVTLDFPK